MAYRVAAKVKELDRSISLLSVCPLSRDLLLLELSLREWTCFDLGM